MGAVMTKHFVLLIACFFLFAEPSHAYLDPGTGSYITQMAIGMIIGGGYLLKVYWKKVADKMRGILNRLKNEQ